MTRINDELGCSSDNGGGRGRWDDDDVLCDNGIIKEERVWYGGRAMMFVKERNPLEVRRRNKKDRWKLAKPKKMKRGCVVFVKKLIGLFWR